MTRRRPGRAGPVSLLLAVTIAATPGASAATEVSVIGLTSGKAVVVIDGGRPRTMNVGDTAPGGVRLLAADSASATFDIGGKRQTLAMGQTIAAAYAAAKNPTVTLTADSRGHFVTVASVNGAPMQVLVDTGATAVAMNSQEARRAGINYLAGEPAVASTANGNVRIYRVKLNTVKVGDITLNNVEGAVQDGGSPPIVLLGMSFLSRLEMRRDGSSLTLTKKF